MKHKKLLKKYFVFFSVIVSLFIVYTSSVKVNAETYTYSFKVNQNEMPGDKVSKLKDYYITSFSDLDTIDWSINNGIYIRMSATSTVIDVTDFLMSFIYDESLNEWQYLSVSYKVHGVYFYNKPYEIFVNDFSCLESNHIKYNNTEYLVTDTKYSVAMSVINHFIYENNVLSIKAFNFNTFNFYDTNYLSDYTHENTLVFVSKLNNQSALISSVNGAVIYQTNDIPFSTVWGDVGIVTNYIFVSSGAIGLKNALDDRDATGTVDAFFALLSNIVTLPIYYLQCLFSFQILGINVYVIIFSFIGIAVILWVLFKAKS